MNSNNELFTVACNKLKEIKDKASKPLIKAYKGIIKQVESSFSYISDLQLNTKIRTEFSAVKEKINTALNSEAVQNEIENFMNKYLFVTSYVVMSFFLVASVVASDINFGYAVVCNGQTVGYSYTRSNAIEALDSAQTEIKKIKGADFDISDVKAIFTIGNDEVFTTPSVLTSSIVRVYDDRMDAFGIFVDGSLVVALQDENQAKDAIDKYTQAFISNSEAKIVGFNKNVELHNVKVNPEFIKSMDDAVVALKSPKEQAVKHIAASGETFYSIAQKYNVSFQDICDVNPTITPERLQIGQEINITASIPLLSVQTKERVTQIEKTPFETNKVPDSKSYKGLTVVVSEGVQGEKEVEYEVIKENGNIVQKTAISERVIKDPVTAVVRVGALDRPSNAPTGKFAVPYYGTVTSRYGRRWSGTHTGIDLAGPTGSPVYASDGGTVTFAGRSGGYGNLVKISHGNGYETYYAHLSRITVSVGDKVAKKEQVGNVGSTGNSTGPHLHFEIRRNGSPLNPAGYIGM